MLDDLGAQVVMLYDSSLVCDNNQNVWDTSLSKKIAQILKQPSEIIIFLLGSALGLAHPSLTHAQPWPIAEVISSGIGDPLRRKTSPDHTTPSWESRC